MADTSVLNTKISALQTQLAATQAGEQSAIAFAQGQAALIKQAVTDALTADNAADQGSIDAASAAIDGVTNGLASSGADLATAIAAPGTNPAPPPVTGPVDPTTV